VRPLEDRLRDFAEGTPHQIALRAKRGGAYREWSYGEVWSRALSAVSSLRAAGVRPGDQVALHGENSPEWVLAYLAVYMAGGVVVPLDAQYGALELRVILEFAECRAVICPGGKRGIVEAVSHAQVIDLDESFFSGSPSEPCRRQSDQLMAVLYTSGTTGDPKGVCLTVGNITSNVESLLQLGLVRPDDTFLSILPLHHAYALTTSVLVPLAAGISITICTSLRGPDITAAIRETNVTVVPCVPRLAEGFDRVIMEGVSRASRMRRWVFAAMTRLSRRVRRLTGWNPGRALFRSVHREFGPQFRFFVSGGAKLDPEAAERLLDLGLAVIEGYGLTETAPVVTLNPTDGIRLGTVGWPIPGVEVRISHPSTEGVGEVIVHGPNVMQGYDRRQAETAGVLREGWLYTGDLGFMDDEGYLHITGRAKEVIVLSNGKNVYPEDIERVLDRSPLVKETCVLAVERSNGRTERLCAIVVPDLDELRRRGSTSARDDLRRGLTTLSQSLPSWMRVAELKLVSKALPRTRLGKLRRAEIQRMAIRELPPDAAVQSPEDEALMTTAQVQRILARLRQVSGYQGEIAPQHHLELDLGVDSLARVELVVALEQEFGCNITEDEVGHIGSVRDLLVRVSGEAREPSDERRWGDMLAARESPPLGELFGLERGKLASAAVHGMRRFALRISQRAYPFDVRGVERLPKRDPFLLCPTHASFIDSALIIMALPDDIAERMFFMGAEEFFRSAFMRRLARVGRVIPTGTSSTVLASMRRAAEALEMGRSVCIFPEGGISRDGYLQPHRAGAGILACEMRVAIVPALIRGSYDIMSYTHPGFRLRPVGVTFGAPITPPGNARNGHGDYISAMAEWRRAIAALRAEDDCGGGPTAGRSPRICEGHAR
jgi:long-chain acyl-CoA synthetase